MIGFRIAACVALAAFGFSAAQNARASLEQRVMRIGDTAVDYKIVLPNGFDAAKA
jgi:hypothetical protein